MCWKTGELSDPLDLDPKITFKLILFTKVMSFNYYYFYLMSFFKVIKDVTILQNVGILECLHKYKNLRCI